MELSTQSLVMQCVCAGEGPRGGHRGNYADQYDDGYNNDPGYDHYGERFSSMDGG